MRSSHLSFEGSLPACCRASLVLALAGGLAACSSGSGPSVQRTTGQSDFTSAPLGVSNGKSGGADGRSAGQEAAPTAALDNAGNAASGAASTRAVEETDLYRLDAAQGRLYYLNAYRGLMVFDVHDIDNPQFLGRSPIYGSPVEMIVRNGIATVVVSDWYGTMDDGSPYHGSIVRGIDATNPADMKVLGEAKLGGNIRDMRVVGDVLYAVSEQYAYDYYGWGDGIAVGGASTNASAIISSVSFAGGVIRQAGSYAPEGSNSVFNVTPNAILFVHSMASKDATGAYVYDVSRTAIDYIDITDPAGAITPRGHLEFDGALGWGADNGRWNVDFADGKTAHVLACGGSYCGSQSGNLVLATADFTSPDAPVMDSLFSMPSGGWSPTARFDSGRMYLSPNDYSGCYYGSGTQCSTPVQIVDLSNPKAPKVAGSTTITGQVWLFMPAGNRLFALGTDTDPSVSNYNSQISLRYLDVSKAEAPSLLGTAKFGENWAWTPANGTFKAFIKDDAQGLVVLPFSGWSSKASAYNNGVQLIEFAPTTIAAAGAAKTKGWVERGIFVEDAAGKRRVVSLSDQTLAVVDYTDRAQPKVVKEITLARNVVDARPLANQTHVAALSTDWWWNNDQDHAELRVLPIDTADEVTSLAESTRLDIDGTNARVFHDGAFSYVVSNVKRVKACSDTAGAKGDMPRPDPGGSGDTQVTCYEWLQRVQVVDLSSGTAVKRGQVDLPAFGEYWYGDWGWGGCYAYDWYWGDGVVQVGGNALAFSRYKYVFNASGEYVDSSRSLYVVDLSNPDAPSYGSTTIVTGEKDWWGNMRAVGDKLYTTHYEWIPNQTDGRDYVRYYLDIIDISNRQQPTIGKKINVPGVFVGASEADPSVIYTIDYRYWGERTANELAVLNVDGDKAYLQGTVEIPGYVGNVFVRNGQAYMTAQTWDSDSSTSSVRLWQVDLSNPSRPAASQSSSKQGWGWLLGVEGDRAFVTSGWSGRGIDVFRLGQGAPSFEKTFRSPGWSPNAISRQGNRLFLASGYWGVQKIELAQ